MESSPFCLPINATPGWGSIIQLNQLLVGASSLCAMQLTVHLFFVLSSLVLRGSSLLAPPPGREQFEDNFVLVDYHDNVSVPFLNYSYKGVVASTNRSYVAFVAVLSNNINERFSYQLPQKGESSNFNKLLKIVSMGYF